jgi:hypothetical protein
MSAGAGDEQARKDARWAAYQARSRRSAQKVQLALVPLWTVSAVVWWFNPQSEPLVRWLFTAVAAMWLVVGAVLWRQIRRPLPPYPGKEEAPGRGPRASN